MTLVDAPHTTPLWPTSRTPQERGALARSFAKHYGNVRAYAVVIGRGDAADLYLELIDFLVRHQASVQDAPVRFTIGQGALTVALALLARQSASATTDPAARATTVIDLIEQAINHIDTLVLTLPEIVAT